MLRAINSGTDCFKPFHFTLVFLGLIICSIVIIFVIIGLISSYLPLNFTHICKSNSNSPAALRDITIKANSE